MMGDAELYQIHAKIYWYTSRGKDSEALTLLRSIQLDALRHARDVVEKHPLCAEQAGEDNTAMPALDRLIRDIELK